MSWKRLRGFEVYPIFDSEPRVFAKYKSSCYSSQSKTMTSCRTSKLDNMSDARNLQQIPLRHSMNTTHITISLQFYLWTRRAKHQTHTVHGFACSQWRGVLPTMLRTAHSCINTIWSLSFFRGLLVVPPTRIIWVSTTCHCKLACVSAWISRTRSTPSLPSSAQSLHIYRPTMLPRTPTGPDKLSYLIVHCVLDPPRDATLVRVTH